MGIPGLALDKANDTANFVFSGTPIEGPVFGQTNRNFAEAVLRSVISSQLHWVALGVGILILGAGISLSVWPLQRDQGTGLVPGATEGRLAELETEGELPGLPARNTTGVGVSGDVSPASYGTTVSDSAEPDSGGVGPGLTAADDAALSDSAALDGRPNAHGACFPVQKED